jgi:oligoribonuclease NrnB/cAMP/cGMP phosphodiesterase (DHH superfamily)
MNPTTVVSLSHSDDFDGIGSQAIIYRYFNELKKPIPAIFGNFKNVLVNLVLLQTDYQDYLFYWAAIIAGITIKTEKTHLEFEKIWESTYLKLHNVENITDLKNNYNLVSQESKERILKDVDLWKNIDLVILSDIGYNKTFKSLFGLLKDIELPLAYFDHHNHDEETREFFSKFCKVYFVDTDRCATQIVHDFFLPDDKISQNISKLGYDTDFSKYSVPNSKAIMSVISYFRKDFNKLSNIVKNYASGINFDESLKKEYELIANWENAQVEEMLNALKQFEKKTSNGKHIMIVFGISSLRSGRSMNRLEEICSNDWVKSQKPNIDDLLLFTIDQTSMNTNIKSDSINVHKIAEHFGGGGHINRAGFRFPPVFIKNKGLDSYTFNDLKLNEFIDEVKEFL